MSAHDTVGPGRPAPGTGAEPATGGAVPSPDMPGRFDLVRESARRDGVEIVIYEPRLPSGSGVERRAERTIALTFLLAGLSATAFLAVYIFWPWEYEAQDPSALSTFYTPLLGVTLGLTLLLLAIGIISWVKKLLPHEIAVEGRHDGVSDEEDQRLLGATADSAVHETGITRRPLLRNALVLGLLPVAAVAVAPLVGGLVRDPHAKDPTTGESRLTYTGWDPALNDGQDVLLVREDGTPVRPADVSVAGQITAFPGIPGGATNEYAASPVLLIHLRQQDAQELRERLYEINEDSMAGNFVAYSKICTHAGCPPSLYEQETNRLLCPCHQSQFLITDNARPIFGPAARALPMLPIRVNDEGYFVASSDFPVPVGPSFWER